MPRSGRRGEFPAGVPRGLAGGREAALYRRVYDVMRRAIADGAWALGDSLPSEASMGARFGVSRITIRQAMQLLQNAGYIRTQRARRAVVIARNPLGVTSDTIDTIEELIEAASDISLRILSWRSEVAPEAAQILGVPPGTDLKCLRSVLTRAGEPHARSIIYFHPTIGTRLKRSDFDDAIVFRDVKRTIWAELATAEDIAQLGVRRGDPMLCTRLVYRGPQGLPVEVALSRYPARDFSLTYSIDVGGET